MTRAAYAVCLEVTDRGAEAAEVSGGAMVPAELEAFSEVARMLGPAIRGILALPCRRRASRCCCRESGGPAARCPRRLRAPRRPRPAQASTPPRDRGPLRAAPARARPAPGAPVGGAVPASALGPARRGRRPAVPATGDVLPHGAVDAAERRGLVAAVPAVGGVLARGAVDAAGGRGWSPPSRPSGAFSRTAPSTPPAEISARPPSAPRRRGLVVAAPPGQPVHLGGPAAR
ncbi:MAG: hypothetical protein R3F43_18025 [bacterium]